MAKGNHVTHTLEASCEQPARPAGRGYYVELAADKATSPEAFGAAIAILIDIAFGELGARHLHVAIPSERTSHDSGR